MLSLCGEAEGSAIALTDPGRLADVYAAFGGSYWGRARYDLAADTARKSMVHAAECRDLARSAAGARILVGSCLQTGRFREVLDVARPVITHIEAAGRETDNFGTPYPPYVTLCGMLGVAEVALGHLAGGVAWNARALQAAISASDRYSMALAHVMWSWSATVAWDGAACASHGDEAVRIADEAGLSGPKLMGMYASGIGRVLAGEYEQGEAALKEALELSGAIGYLALRSDAYFGLTLAALARKDWPGARSSVDAATRHAEDTGERKLAVEFLRLLAQVHVAESDVDGAIDLLRRACAMSAEEGTIASGARCHLDLSQALARRGEIREALRELRLAAADFDRCELHAGATAARSRRWGIIGTGLRAGQSGNRQALEGGGAASR